MAPNERTRNFLCSVFLVVFCAFGGVMGKNRVADVTGWRVDHPDEMNSRANEDGTTVLYTGQEVALRLFGTGFTDTTALSFAPRNDSRGASCNDVRTTDVFEVEPTGSTSARVTIIPETLDFGDYYFFFCVKDRAFDVNIDDGTNESDTDLEGWIHQGGDRWMVFTTEPVPVKTTLLPLWLQVILIAVLLCCSGLFSGLNLGLMSLDKTELQIVENCGSAREKGYAKKIAPLRKRGNYLLCTILLGNVMVNNTLAILMDDLTGSGGVAIVAATAGIVVFGEIIPQAVCSRYGLAIGAHTIWFTRLFMFVTFPVSFPISKLLDWVLGEEMGTVYNRTRLRELVTVTQQNTDLGADEVNIITGALQLSKKKVQDIMTKIEDVFMIEYHAILDFETMSEIMKTGYTRIPVYEKTRNNIVALLNIKDLAFIDPDDRTPLRTVAKFYNHPINYTFLDTKLDVMLEEFKKGRSHMCFVHRVNDTGPGDPYYETVGVVTLEDVIEEIIQSEIVDETDTVTDNIKKAPRIAQAKDFSVFNQPDDENYPRMSPQLALATFQYMSTSVPCFKPELISETVLQRLLKQNVVVNFRLTDPNSQDCYIFSRGRTCDYFLFILQGRVEVDIGREHMVFEGGPFMYFGLQALTGMSNSLSKQLSVTSISSASDSIYSRQPQYAPDFSVRALTDLQYLKIRRSHYIAARRATMMERQPKTPEGDFLEDPFTKEWNRANSFDPDKVRVAPGESKDSLAVSVATDGDVGGRTRASTTDTLDLEANNVGTPLISKQENSTENKDEGS